MLTCANLVQNTSNTEHIAVNTRSGAVAAGPGCLVPRLLRHVLLSHLLQVGQLHVALGQHHDGVGGNVGQNVAEIVEEADCLRDL